MVVTVMVSACAPLAATPRPIATAAASIDFFIFIIITPKIILICLRSKTNLLMYIHSKSSYISAKR